MPQIKQGSIVAGKYRLERTLARGGMGSVWVARHLQLDMLVAIKFMDAAAASSDEARTRFEREAKAAAQIQSPHVVHVHDYGMEGATPYLVMELLRGEDLGARLRRERRLSLAEVSRILTQAARALRRAHEAGLIHRDLKPANLFLARTDDDEEVVKILDFGVVKVAGPGAAEEATQSGVVVGSVHYMSPEQARGSRDIDARSDVWSLGVVAFRALVGHHPFPGDQIGDVIVKICSEPIPKPTDLAPDLGPKVDAFFTRALARNPAERFQSARDFANELALLAGTGPMAATGAWPLAPAALETPPPPRAKSLVIRETDAAPLLPAPPRPQFDSDASTEDAAPPEAPVRRPSQISASDGLPTEAPRVSDVPFVPARAVRGGPRLILAVIGALALLVGGWLFFQGDRSEAPAPTAAATAVTTDVASSEHAPIDPAGRTASQTAPPVVAATASARTEDVPAPSSRPSTSGARPGRPPVKGPPTKRINSTLGI